MAQSFGKVQSFNVHLEGKGDAHPVHKVHINGVYRISIEWDVETDQEVLVVQTTDGGAIRIQPCSSNTGYLMVNIQCSGDQRDSAYHCCMQPRHKGMCRSAHKRVDFWPDTGTGPGAGGAA